MSATQDKFQALNGASILAQNSGCFGEPLLPLYEPICAYTKNGQL